MWRGTDSRISLWRLDNTNNINLVAFHEYGPYFGWQPIALTTANNGYSYVLWRSTGGSVALWRVDANLNFVSGSPGFGPYNGWTAESLRVDTNTTNRVRVLWRGTDGAVAIWIVDPALNLIASRVYGASFGYDPTSGAVAQSDQTLESTGDQEVDKKAAAAMEEAGRSSATPMPEQFPIKH
jgi:hypothetical protein